MSIATELSRIQADRNTIRAKLVELGMANTTDNLTKLASAVESLVNQGAVSVNVKEGETYTIPAGYHNGAGTVSGVSGGGNYSLQSKTITPTKRQQSVTSDEGFYGLSDVIVASIPDAYQDVTSVTATAGEVLTGKIFVASDGSVITGTMPNIGTVSKVLSGTTVSYTIPKGYHDGTGTITITLEEKTVTPSKSAQTIIPAEGKVLSKVVVQKIPDAYQDVTSVTATEAKVLSGSKFVDATGAVLTGSMANNGDTSQTIDGLTKSTATIPAGYTSGGTVTLTSDIEDALAAI